MGVQRSGSALRALKVELPHQLGSIKGQIVKGSFFLPSNRSNSAVLDHGYRSIVILGPRVSRHTLRPPPSTCLILWQKRRGSGKLEQRGGDPFSGLNVPTLKIGQAPRGHLDQSRREFWGLSNLWPIRSGRSLLSRREPLGAALNKLSEHRVQQLWRAAQPSGARIRARHSPGRSMGIGARGPGGL